MRRTRTPGLPVIWTVLESKEVPVNAAKSVVRVRVVFENLCPHSQ
jgi:hypothetical protein